MIEASTICINVNNTRRPAAVKSFLITSVVLVFCSSLTGFAYPDVKNTEITRVAHQAIIGHATSELLERPATMNTNSPFLANDDSPITPFEISVSGCRIRSRIPVGSMEPMSAI